MKWKDPHVHQRYSFRVENKVKEPVPLEDLQRVQTEDDPSLKYRQTDHRFRSVIHWGQRKLLMSEIEFLTLYAFGEEGVVVYAGAAPGRHIPFLADMFPKLIFYLVDPANFSDISHSRITIVQEYFTDEMCVELRQKFGKIFFISDIRTGDPKVNEYDELESNIERDMKMQKEWVLLLQPVASMLKFRLPWKPGKTIYLEGDVMYPVWGPETTTETRLIVTSPKDKEYDNTKYEQQLFYFNMVSRTRIYKVPKFYIDNIPGLDRCYDCASEIRILEAYFSSKCQGSIFEKVVETSLEINKVCSNSRTLNTKIDANQRKSWFPGRIYDPNNKTLIDVITK